MEVAARSLRAGNDTVGTIARNVGYRSEYAFNRAFVRHHGVPPGRYRAAARVLPETFPRPLTVVDPTVGTPTTTQPCSPQPPPAVERLHLYNGEAEDYIWYVSQEGGRMDRVHHLLAASAALLVSLRTARGLFGRRLVRRRPELVHQP